MTDGSALRLRAGAPPDALYAPLLDGLDQPPAAWRLELRRDEPAALRAALARGDLDLALLPVADVALLGTTIEIVPGIAWGSDARAPWARLAHGVPLDEVRALAATCPDGTAARLAAALFGASGRPLRPETDAAPPSPGPATARVLEGDAALSSEEGPALDLGQVWSELTGLPFVWLLWAARPGVVDRRVYALLHTARTRGRQHLAALAIREAARTGIAPDRLEQAWRSAAIFRLGRRQLAALEAFGDALVAAGAGPAWPKPRFVPLGAASACHAKARSLSGFRTSR